MNASTLRTVRIAAWLAVVVLAVLLVWLLAFNKSEVGRGVLAIHMGGPFRLADQSGATVTQAALKGHPSLLYFGYTYCPDVCPTTLANISKWMGDLGSDADKLKVYFITVDPERDTQQVMAAYLQAFDPRIVGLTGSRPAIDQILKDYRVYSRKVDAGDGAYTMDHTASIYLLDSNARFVGTLEYQEKDKAALAKLRTLIARS